MRDEYELITVRQMEPTEPSRSLLFQAIADREPVEQINPEYFIANYMQFVNMVIAHGHPSQDTSNTYERHINSFLNWCFHKAAVSPFKLKEKHLELYRSMLYEEKTINGTSYHKNSIFNHLVAVKAFYKAAVKQNIISENPCLNITAATDSINDLPFAYYKMEEIKALVDYVKGACPEFECRRNLVCIYLMAVAGLRCVEVHRANREDIDWKNFTMVVHGKGHDGLIYLDNSTAKVIWDYLECLNRHPQPVAKVGNVTPLIVSNASNKYGTRLSREAIRWNMNKVLKEAGMKKEGAACHVFRHSCATALYESTHDLRVVQDTLRHRHPNVTARYAHVVKQLQNRPTAVLSQMLENDAGQDASPKDGE